MIRQAILLTVAYADVFDYPLTAPEIHRYLPELRTTPEQVYEVLAQHPGVQKTGTYYTLPGRASIIALRFQRELISRRLWQYARRYGQWVASIPFIRMVAVTGSLAVNNCDDTADIDYLVVTAPSRLWVCRAMILALGRLAALEGLNLCPNYLITTRALHFTDHNLYVAREITQMSPLSGLDVYYELRAQNKWVDKFLPNANGVPHVTRLSRGSGAGTISRQILERVLRTSIGERMEQWEMKRKIRKLTGEQRASPESGFSADFCKGHNNLHARRTSEAFNERLDRLARDGVL